MFPGKGSQQEVPKQGSQEQVLQSRGDGDDDDDGDDGVDVDVDLEKMV